MLAQMRQLTRGFLSRVLLVLLALAFAIWGVNDVFSGMGGNAVARVSGETITPRDLERDLNNIVQQQRQEDPTFTRARAIESGLHTQVLESLIGQRAYDVFVEKLGVQASDQQVANRIRTLPPTIDPLSGAFSESQYAQFLQSIGYTPAQFERLMRNDLANNQLTAALTAGVRAPRSYGALALAFESERRTISIAEIPAARVGAIAAPTEEQLTTFHTELRDRLRVPERRALTLVAARAADFTARVDVPEARIQEEFAARQAQFSRPERRSFVQISAPNEAQARTAATRLAAGEEPQAAARALDLQIVRYDDRPVTEIPDAAVGRGVFALPADARPQAVRGTLSPWAAVMLTGVTAAVTADYAAHRDELRAELANEEAIDLLNEQVAAFNDVRAEGTPIAEAARAHGLSVSVVPAVDARGQTPEGQSAPDFIDNAELLRAAFETPEGEATDFIPAAGGADVIVQVDSVTPESVRPLAEVRAQLIDLWTTRERGRRLDAIGAQIIEAVHGGQDFAVAARANGGVIQVSSREINRQAAQRALPSRGLGGKIFDAREGEVVSDPRIDGEALLVAQVEAIVRADPTAEAAAVEQLRTQFQEGVAQSLEQAIRAAVVDAGRPTRNDRILNQLYGQAPGDDGDDATP